MILLLGTGYIGRAFARELGRRGINFEIANRSVFDYTNFGLLSACLRNKRPKFVICAAGVTGAPNVDGCEAHRTRVISGNVALPLTIAHACVALDIPLGQVSSGCIYTGPAPRPGGWTENDPPNFHWDSPTPGSFYSGSKAFMEECLKGFEELYLWRIRMPFDETEHQKNLLTKLLAYRVTYESPPNSISHLGEAVSACIDLWERGAAYGTYHVTNPGAVTNRQIVEMLQSILKPARAFDLWQHDIRNCDETAVAPRSNCVLNTDKLQAAGIKMRQVTEALTESIAVYKTGP